MNQYYQSEDEIAEVPENKAWFFFVLVFIVIDYGRIQDTIKFLALFKPALIVTIILTGFMLKFGLTNLKIQQIRLTWFFIFLLIILILFAQNRHLAFNATINLIMIIPFIFSCCACVNTIKKYKQLIITIICLMSYQSIWSILHGGRGTSSILSDQNDLALFVATWLPFSFVFFLFTKNLLKKLFFGFTTLIGVGAIVVSFSRGGFLGLLAMIIVFWFFSPRKILMLFLIALSAATMFLFADLASKGGVGHQKKGSYASEMNFSQTADGGTGKQRIESWKSGWNMFKANPFGVGAGNFGVRFPQYQTDFFSRGMWGRVAHSLWFTLLPETGIIGVLIYISLIVVNIRDVFRIKKYAKSLCNEDAKEIQALAIAFLGSLAGFFTSATFLTVLYYPHFWYISGLIASLLLITKNMVFYTEMYSQYQESEDALNVS